jgi:hypothetical protein
VGIQPSKRRSNLSTRYFRNRIPHDWFQKLQDITPGEKTTAENSADILRKKEILEEVKEKAWQRTAVRKNGILAFVFMLPMLESLPERTVGFLSPWTLLEWSPH